MVLEIDAQEYLPVPFATRKNIMATHSFACQGGSVYACGDVILQFSQLESERCAWVVSCLENPNGEILWEAGGYQALWHSDGSPRNQSWYASYQGSSYRLGSMRFVAQGQHATQGVQNLSDWLEPANQRLEALLQKTERSVLDMAARMQQQMASSETALSAFARHLAVQFKHQNDRCCKFA